MPDTFSNGSEASQKAMPPLLGMRSYTELLLLQVGGGGEGKGI